MPRPPDPRRTQLLGLLVATVFGAGIVSMYVYATGDPWRGEQTIINAHFTSVSGLKKGSDVLLAGKLVGRVDNVAFVNASYDCDPATEDVGRDASDACEPWLFCAPQSDGGGLCAELLPYSGAAADYADKGCLINEQCKDTEVCFNAEFRRHNPDATWYGPDNTCIPFKVEHQRVEVRMAIHADKLEFISENSKASVASKGPLGDQQINIDSGTGDSIGEGGRLQSKPTLLEELNDFRERIGAVSDRFSGKLGSFRELRAAMKRETDEPPSDLRTSLRQTSDAMRDVATHEGQLGELFKPDSRDDAIASIRDLRAASDGVRRDIVAWRRKNTPKLHDLSQGMADFAASAEEAADPTSKTTGAKVLTDERFGLDVAARVSKVTDSIGSARGTLGDAHERVLEMREELQHGEGTLGELVRSPDMYYGFVKAIAMFDLFDRNDGFKSLVRSVIAAGDEYEGADPNRDRAVPRPAPARTPTPTDTAAPADAKRGPPPPPPPAPLPPPRSDTD